MEEATGHWLELKRLGIKNNVIGYTTTREAEMLKFFHSPEFLRYQYVSWTHLLDLLGAPGRPSRYKLSLLELSRTMGVLLANSVSTLIQVRWEAGKCGKN